MSEKISIDEATVKLLDLLNQNIKKLSAQVKETNDLVKYRIPEGIIEPYNITATTEQTVVKSMSNKYWFSICVINDGPDSCYVVVNTEASSTTPHRIDANGSFEVDMGAPKIKDIMLYCVSGTASLRIRGVR
ncbi:MAG: hypothetical protein PHW73_13130 [Atribacterota bacterium]|nr:hypothetical protein [Atribacterota bacterium]